MSSRGLGVLTVHVAWQLVLLALVALRLAEGRRGLAAVRAGQLARLLGQHLAMYAAV